MAGQSLGAALVNGGVMIRARKITPSPLSALVVLLAISGGERAYGGQAFAILDTAYQAAGNALDGRLIEMVWSPNTFVLPQGSANTVLSGNFNTQQDYVFAFEIQNNGTGITPITNFLASNPNGKLIDSEGWISNSGLDTNANNITFFGAPNNPGIGLAAAAPNAPGFPAQINYLFASPIMDQNDPARPANQPWYSTVFYFSSPAGTPMGGPNVQGIFQFAGPPIVQVPGSMLVPSNPVAGVPEPPSVVMFVIGTLGVLGYGLYRRKQASDRNPRFGEL